jgi:hypothetical protein
MDRRKFLGNTAKLAFLTGWGSFGCRSKQHAHVLNSHEQDMVGSHTAGAETWEPLIQTSVGQLLGRQHVVIVVSADAAAPFARKRICFVGVENKSAEEIGDFREQIYQKIDTCINESQEFEVITRKFVEAGLRQCGLRPDDLFVPGNRRMFTSAMEQLEQPFDYLLYATITSGTTQSNGKDYQRDYLLTLELIHMETGKSDKESAELRKGYHKTKLGKLKHYGKG